MTRVLTGLLACSLLATAWVAVADTSALAHTLEPHRYYGSGETPGDVVTVWDCDGNQIGSGTVADDGSWSIDVTSDSEDICFQVNGVDVDDEKEVTGPGETSVTLIRVPLTLAQGQQIVDQIYLHGPAVEICTYLTENGVSPSQVLHSLPPSVVLGQDAAGRDVYSRPEGSPPLPGGAITSGVNDDEPEYWVTPPELRNRRWIYIGDARPRYPDLLMSRIWWRAASCAASDSEGVGDSGNGDSPPAGTSQQQSPQGAQQSPAPADGASGPASGAQGQAGNQQPTGTPAPIAEQRSAENGDEPESAESRHDSQPALWWLRWDRYTIVVNKLDWQGGTLVLVTETRPWGITNKCPTQENCPQLIPNLPVNVRIGVMAGTEIMLDPRNLQYSHTTWRRVCENEARGQSPPDCTPVR